MIAMSHQQRAVESVGRHGWVSQRTLKDFIVMQGEETLDVKSEDAGRRAALLRLARLTLKAQCATLSGL